ncbi:MAG TPA: hypothetical protein VNW15_06210 [Rhizomicrobium sp.]|nr:hypothetical protein [Rhizomicrobium sp.]
MKKRGLKSGRQKLLALAMLVPLAACASAAKPEAMQVTAQASDKAFPQPLQHAMCVRAVTGGEETNPLWASKVDNKGFQSALGLSLDSAGLTAAGSSCSYPIDVNLLGLSQPFAGFDLTVTSHVNYKVYDSSGQPFLLATIDAPFTATVSDAFAAVERLRLANEGSIRTSIQQFFDKLRDTKPK